MRLRRRLRGTFLHALLSSSRHAACCAITGPGNTASKWYLPVQALANPYELTSSDGCVSFSNTGHADEVATNQNMAGKIVGPGSAKKTPIKHTACGGSPRISATYYSLLLLRLIGTPLCKSAWLIIPAWATLSQALDTLVLMLYYNLSDCDCSRCTDVRSKPPKTRVVWTLPMLSWSVCSNPNTLRVPRQHALST